MAVIMYKKTEAEGLKIERVPAASHGSYVNDGWVHSVSELEQKEDAETTENEAEENKLSGDDADDAEVVRVLAKEGNVYGWKTRPIAELRKKLGL